MSSLAPTAFQMERQEADESLLRAYNVRCHSDIDRAVPPEGIAPMSPEFLLRSSLFEAACRRHGAKVCDGCGRLTIFTDITVHGDLSLCEGCQDRVDTEGVHVLPDWVKDRDLTEILPALVRAFVKSARCAA